MGLCLVTVIVVSLIQPVSTAVAFERGFQCDFAWRPDVVSIQTIYSFDDAGINVAFLIHNEEKTDRSDVELINTITEAIVGFVKTFAISEYGTGAYSLGLGSFNRNPSILFSLGKGLTSHNPQDKHASDFLKEFRHMTYEGTGCNISGALLMARKFFGIHQGNRVFAPNLCILLTTAPPDNPVLARTAAQSLQDMGVSIVVIGVGDGVRKDDVEELASNKNVALMTSRYNSSSQERHISADNITVSIISKLKRVSVLPRFSMCYQTYLDIVIIMDISNNHTKMIFQVSDFVSQFYLARVSLRVLLIKSPTSDTSFMASYKTMINTNQGILFETHSSRYNLSSSLRLCRRLFQNEPTKRHLAENILIVVTDNTYDVTNDVKSESRACVESGIHVMALGVGEDVSPDLLGKIISDPTGIVFVDDSRDIFWGLQSLNRKLCPAVCDHGWIYHEDTCYHYRLNFMRTWMKAKSECREFNGKLVSITNEAKLNWVTHTFSKEGFPIYIGLRKHLKGSSPIMSNLRWENGQPLVLTNWSTDGDLPQPDGGAYEACVAWYPDGWRDVGCSVAFDAVGWICEREAGNITKAPIKGVNVRPFWEEQECGMEEKYGVRPPHETAILKTGEKCKPVFDVYSSKSYPAHAYNCSNGELISKYLVCDGVSHCRDGSDETGCASTCDETQFQCDNDRCISLAFVCDFWDDCEDNSDESHCVHEQCSIDSWQCANGQCVGRDADCDLYYDCFDKSDEERCGDTCRQTRCYDGTCIPDSWRGDGEVDCGGYTREDETDLRKEDPCYFGKRRELYLLFATEKYRSVTPSCSMVFDGFGKHYDSYSDACHNGSFVCPAGFYRCPDSFCIQLERVCDGTMDCIDGEDEMGCDDYVCPGYFRCPGANCCLHPSRLCDGEVDCPGGKDEVMCDFYCPQNCTCYGGLVKCDNTVRRVDLATRTLIFSSQEVQQEVLVGVNYLTEVVLCDVGLTAVGDVFKNQVNLQRMNISMNRIQNIPDNSLSNLENLKMLDISFNSVKSISEKSFKGLSKLRQLHMRYTALTVLPRRSFLPLSSLEFLDLTGSRLHSISVGAFSGLVSLRFLSLKGNAITDFDQGIYDGLERVEEIQTEVFSLCCPQVRPASVEESRCLSPEASISSCSDLMANVFLRTSIWILCILSLVGNALSSGMRIVWEKRSMKIGFGVFVTHLGVSDFLMGVYLLIIAIADTRFQGGYIWKDHEWRQSHYCRAAGFLATLSSEASAMFIFLITLDRFLVMKFPFGSVRFRFKSATAFSVIAWILAVTIAGIPLLPTFSHWAFYSKNGACLALPFFTEKQPGWQYSAVVFLGFNFVAFILIACGQYSIYRAMKKGSTISTKHRSAQDLAVAQKLLMIVTTDFLCWFPVGVIGLLALSGTTIGGEVYAWTAVFVLPINSALNPFLYTIPTILQKLRSNNGDLHNKNKLKRKFQTEFFSITEVTKGSSETKFVTVDDIDHNSDLVLLEDVLLQFQSNTDRKEIIRNVFNSVMESSLVLRPDQSSPNAIYLRLSGTDVENICITTKKNHMGGDITRLILSSLALDEESNQQRQTDV